MHTASIDTGQVSASDLALFTDLYELTMLQAYWQLGMDEPATFSLFVRRLPETRNYLLACGLEQAIDSVAALRFHPEQLEYLRSLGLFQPAFLEWLATFRFEGDIHAVREGEPVFAQEPLLEVVAPIAQAQLIETLVMNQVNLQTVIASKAARVVAAAPGCTIVDFGLRRAPGTDAGMMLARASYVAGVHATSNVLAGQRYGIPVAGTMAHSFIQSFDDEAASFRAFAQLYPNTTLLVDTYDTLAGVRRVIELAAELGANFNVRALRLDSGDLATLGRAARQLLDQAGLREVQLFASGGLDEYSVRDLVAAGAAFDGFGVGTRMAVSEDAPSLDIAYKLTRYAGRDRMKLSTGKPTLPGRKQVFRIVRAGQAQYDVLALHDERIEHASAGESARPLLRPVMIGGRRIGPVATLQEARAYARARSRELPAALQSIDPARPPYEIRTSPGLQARIERVKGELR